MFQYRIDGFVKRTKQEMARDRRNHDSIEAAENRLVAKMRTAAQGERALQQSEEAAKLPTIAKGVVPETPADKGDGEPAGKETKTEPE